MSKDYIKDQLLGAKGQYSIAEFDKLASTIHKSMKDSDYNEKKVNVCDIVELKKEVFGNEGQRSIFRSPNLIP